jgi:hypothetical protein
VLWKYCLHSSDLNISDKFILLLLSREFLMKTTIMIDIRQVMINIHQVFANDLLPDLLLEK